MPSIDEPEKTVYAWRVCEGTAPAVCIIYCHGNSEDVRQSQGLLRYISSALSAVVVAVEYTGYGPTYRQEKPSMEQCCSDVRTIATHVSSRGELPTVLWGRSMGCAPACYASVFRGVRGLVLQSPFLDPVSVKWPFGHPIKTFFDNSRAIEHVSVPVLILRGSADRVVPPWHAQRLADMLQGRQTHRCTLVTIDGANHNDMLSRNFATETMNHIAAFIYA